MGMAGMFWQTGFQLQSGLIGSLAILGLMGLGQIIARLNKSSAEQRQLNETLRQEIARRQDAEKRLRHDALHDPLTALANRSLILDRVRHCVQLAKRRSDYLFAVLFMDVDDFKVVNDSLGHAVGDRLLVEVARELTECVRATDIIARCTDSVASRVGGDEFVILLDGIKQQDDAVVVAERIQERLKRPYDLSGHQRVTTVSMGITTNQVSDPETQDMLRDADIALYQAKARGKARSVFFDRPMRDEAMARLQTENDLRQAVERRELRLQFQPIVSVANSGIEGFEVLVRWEDSRRGLVPPSKFIPTAEETGLIVPIGEWVFREACRLVQSWQEKFPHARKVPVNVNVSGRQLTEGGFLEQVDRILEDTGLDPMYLNLEITESVMMQNLAVNVIRNLADRGFTIYMDDFGTGYSSLSCLHVLPLHGIKLDRSFIDRIAVDQRHATSVQAVVILAHSHDLKVVAEGIESAEQLAPLKDFDCDFAQGFYFSKPIDASEAATLIEG
jgi:diguanylate cyclase (GGDEF)-like protein